MTALGLLYALSILWLLLEPYQNANPQSQAFCSCEAFIHLLLHTVSIILRNIQ